MVYNCPVREVVLIRVLADFHLHVEMIFPQKEPARSAVIGLINDNRLLIDFNNFIQKGFSAEFVTLESMQGSIY